MRSKQWHLISLLMWCISELKSILRRMPRRRWHTEASTSSTDLDLNHLNSLVSLSTVLSGAPNLISGACHNNFHWRLVVVQGNSKLFSWRHEYRCVSPDLSAPRPRINPINRINRFNYGNSSRPIPAVLKSLLGWLASPRKNTSRFMQMANPQWYRVLKWNLMGAEFWRAALSNNKKIADCPKTCSKDS